VPRSGDKNKDDKLDAAELKDFYTHDEDNYHGAEIAKHFGGPDKATAALDTNKDGAPAPFRTLRGTDLTPHRQGSSTPTSSSPTPPRRTLSQSPRTTSTSRI
jgi:hypothetical protein